VRGPTLPCFERSCRIACGCTLQARRTPRAGPSGRQPASHAPCRPNLPLRGAQPPFPRLRDLANAPAWLRRVPCAANPSAAARPYGSGTRHGARRTEAVSSGPGPLRGLASAEKSFGRQPSGCLPSRGRPRLRSEPGAGAPRSSAPAPRRSCSIDGRILGARGRVPSSALRTWLSHRAHPASEYRLPAAPCSLQPEGACKRAHGFRSLASGRLADAPGVRCCVPCTSRPSAHASPPPSPSLGPAPASPRPAKAASPTPCPVGPRLRRRPLLSAKLRSGNSLHGAEG